MAVLRFDLANTSHPSRSPAPFVRWSAEQRVRLDYERRLLQRNFAYHPYVRVRPVAIDAATGEYEVQFRTRTLCVGESGQLEYTDTATLHVWVPPEFPRSAPQARPVNGLFHPNISWEGIHLSNGWRSSDTLADFVRRLGELLAWRAYDPQSVINVMAMRWLDANASLLPVDRAADFGFDAGGAPLIRIEQHGRQDLVEIARYLEGFRQTMLSDTPPGRAAVQEWVRQARGRLELLIEPDVPAAIRERAAQLDLWLQDLPATVPAWEAIHLHRAEVQALRDATTTLGDQRAALAEQIASLAALAPADAVVDLKSGFAAIPPRKGLDLVRLKLPNLADAARATLREVRDRAERLSGAAVECPPPEDTPLGRQIRGEARAVAATARGARRAAAAVAAEVEPLLSEVELESQAVQRLDDWRHFLDLISGARDLEARIAHLGAAGLHAFFMEDGSGISGPFQLDEAFTFGTARAALRSTARNRVRLLDVQTVRLLGRSDTGTLVVPRPSPNGSGAGEPVTFRVKERWDDLVVRFEFLLRETIQMLDRLAAPPTPSLSWCGQVLMVLADPHVIQRIREEHRLATNRWRVLLHDLQALGPVKARIETWNVVQRLLEVVPRIRRRLSEARAELDACEQALAKLVARCTRDLASDQLIVPPPLSARFAAGMTKRDRAAEEIRKLERLQKQLGAQLARQFAGRPLVGTAEIPVFQTLPGFPPELATRIAAMSDGQLEEDVSELEIALNMPVRGQTWKPGPTARTRPASVRQEPPLLEPDPSTPDTDRSESKEPVGGI